MSTIVLGRVRAHVPLTLSLPLHAFQENPQFSFDSRPDDPPEGERWSSWDGATHAQAAARLGHHCSRRRRVRPRHPQDGQGGGRPRRPPLVPDGTSSPQHDTLLAAKRYRTSEHRMFHRDAGYQKAAGSVAAGRCGPWPGAPSSAQGAAVGPVGRRRVRGARRPVGAGAARALPRPAERPRDAHGVHRRRPCGAALASARPAPDLLAELFEQLRDALTVPRLGARRPLALQRPARREELVLIDWPQIVDIIELRFEFLQRDTANMCRWFRSRGLDVDEGEVLGDLVAAATSRW